MSRRILMVVDKEEVRLAVQELLITQGYQIKSDTCRSDVFKVIEEFKPELILLNIGQGEPDGREICKKIKEHIIYRSIPVIILSSHPEIYNTIIQAGANDVLAKPFQNHMLLSRIERQLSSASKPQLFNIN